MECITKVKINGTELTSEPTEGAYITGVSLDDNNGATALEIGAVGSNRLQFSIINPTASNLDGAEVKFYVSPVDLGILSQKELIEGEIGEEADDTVIDEIDEEGEDDEEVGEEMTDEELAETEAEIEEANKNLYEVYEGTEDETAAEITTEGEEEEEWKLLGTFYVYSQKNSSKKIDVVCYDGFVKMTETFNSTATTIPAIFEEFKTLIKTGYKIEVDTPEDLPNIEVKWTPCTYRQAAGIFAGLIGGYASFDEEGTLCFCPYGFGDAILLKDELIAYTPITDGRTEIGAITCGNLSAGAGQGVDFSNPYMTQDVLDSILVSYKGLTFEGATVTALWEETIETGRIIRLMSAEEYRNFIKIKNQIEREGATPELIASYNSTGTAILASSQHIIFSSDAVTTIRSAEATEAQKENPIPDLVKASAELAAQKATTAETAAGEATTAAAEASSLAESANQTAIDAAKTATNFINVDDNGAMKITRDTDDCAVVIDADSVDILNGEEVMARFGADKIELGKNSKSSTIDFCQSAGEITSGEIKVNEFDTGADNVRQAKIESINKNGSSVLLSAARERPTYSSTIDEQFTEKNAAKMFLYTREGEGADPGTENTQRGYVNASGDKGFASVLVHAYRSKNSDNVLSWDNRVAEAVLSAKMFETEISDTTASPEIRVEAYSESFNSSTPNVYGKISMSQAPHIAEHDSAAGTVKTKEGGNYDITETSTWKNVGNTAMTLGKGVWLVTYSVIFRGKTTSSGSTDAAAGNRYAAISLDATTQNESVCGTKAAAGANYRAQGLAVLKITNTTGTARCAVYSTQIVGVSGIYLKAVRII